MIPNFMAVWMLGLILAISICFIIFLINKKNIFGIVICIILTAMMLITFGQGINSALDRIKNLPPTYHAITDIGDAELPVQAAVINGKSFDTTAFFKVILYNPELYYLEEQKYICICNDICLVTSDKESTYRIVPRSFIEEQ